MYIFLYISKFTKKSHNQTIPSSRAKIVKWLGPGNIFSTPCCWYIYIYIERERERERESVWEREQSFLFHIFIKPFLTWISSRNCMLSISKKTTTVFLILSLYSGLSQQIFYLNITKLKLQGETLLSITWMLLLVVAVKSLTLSWLIPVFSAFIFWYLKWHRSFLLCFHKTKIRSWCLDHSTDI